MLYSSTSISLALLELLIHSAGYNEMRVNQLVTIDTGNVEPASLELSQLKENWQTDVDYSKFIGDEFLRGKIDFAYAGAIGHYPRRNQRFNKSLTLRF